MIEVYFLRKIGLKKLNKMKILVTGAAGFIGYHLSSILLKNNHHVYGIDNLNNYYDVSLKLSRLKNLKKKKNFYFEKIDLINYKKLNSLFKKNNFDIVINLAAQAGVRHSIKKPFDYFKSNLLGFYNILEITKKFKIKKFIFSSTSSVYGNDKRFPLQENRGSNHPIQFYAATKKANEIIAHSYSSMFDMHIIGLRFFTVYGPWGRPDMALFKFVKNILEDKEIEIYNRGNHYRDFTYVDDVVDCIKKIIDINLKSNLSFKNYNDPGSSSKKFAIYNISNGKTVKLNTFINEIERQLNKKAKKSFLPMQIGDVQKTLSSKIKLSKIINLKKPIDIKVGIKKFISWYLSYYKI
jgi:UDP-glucuronate 4-epimerase